MSGPLIVHVPSTTSRWVLHPPTDPWGDGYVAVMRVELHDDGVDADGTVELSWPSDLVGFLEGLEADWRGWAGERRWESICGELAVDARHDGRGEVTLGATLRAHTRGPSGWSARVAVVVEPGEELSRLVADVRALFAG